MLIAVLPPEVIDCGVNDTEELAGSPVAPKATSWGVPTAVVLMVLDAEAPAVTVWAVGVSPTVKSPGGGGGVPALNRAMPDAQYMVDPNDPARLCEPGAERSW